MENIILVSTQEWNDSKTERGVRNEWYFYSEVDEDLIAYKKKIVNNDSDSDESLTELNSAVRNSTLELISMPPINVSVFKKFLNVSNRYH